MTRITTGGRNAGAHTPRHTGHPTETRNEMRSRTTRLLAALPLAVAGALLLTPAAHATQREWP